MAYRLPGTGCPVTIAGNVVTFAPWDVFWKRYSDCAVDGSWYVYNITRSASSAISAKGGTEAGGHTFTVADASTWATGDACVVIPSSTLNVHATIAALQTAASALDTTVLAYAAADRPIWHEPYTQANKPQHVLGHLSRQRCIIQGIVSASADQSANTTQVLWENFGVRATAATVGAAIYEDTGAGKTGGGYLCRYMWATQTAPGLLCFYNKASGNGKSSFDFCHAAGAAYGIGTVTGTITAYHCTVKDCGTAGYYGNNLASTYQNCVAIRCTTGFLGKTNGTFTKCASTDTTGSEAGLNSLTMAQLDLWGGNNAGYFDDNPRILTTSVLFDAGTYSAAHQLDIDGNAITNGHAPIGCHVGTVNAYGVTWPAASVVLDDGTANDFTSFAGAQTASYAPDFPATTSVAADDTVNGVAGAIALNQILAPRGSATAEAHTADEVLKSAGGNWNDDNLGAGDEDNVADGVAFGLAQTGTLVAGPGDPTAPTWGTTPLTAGNGQITFSVVANAPTDEIWARWKRKGATTWEAASASFKRTGTGAITVTGLTLGQPYICSGYTLSGTLQSSWLPGLESTPKTTAICTPEEAVRTLLLAHTDFSALAVARVYPQAAPQKATVPYAVYQRVDTEVLHQMVAASGLSFARVQLEFYGTNWAQCKDLAEAARMALDGYRGTVTAADGSTLAVKIRRAADGDGFSEPIAGQERVAHRVVQDYLVSHAETVPTFA